MIRFTRVSDIASDTDRQRLEDTKVLFRRIFPKEKEYADRLEPLLRDRAAMDFEAHLLLAEDDRRTIIGLSLVLYFPAIRCGFLDYIGSDPKRRHRGIGRALYEVSREYLRMKGARGLFLEIPPDDPRPDVTPELLEERRDRARFYEGFGALPITGTGWSDPPEPLGYHPTYLVFDGLGIAGPPTKEITRKAIRAILQARYRRTREDPFIRVIVESVKDDPVRLRSPRYEPTGVAPPGPAEHGRWRPIRVVVPEHHEIHHVRERGYVERPARVRAVVAAMKRLPVEFHDPVEGGEAPIRAVHDGDFVSYLRRATENLGENETIYPEVFPIRRPEKKPREMAIRSGYYCSDTFTPLSRSAYRAARSSADCALTGARLLMRGDQLVYAVCRPPGHHAERRIYGGFCYFNNAAVAAHALSKDGRVALLDIDYHHGNGQQDIFYKRSDVFTLSIHGHPRDHFPYFSGYADERGEGEGAGFNRNLPTRDFIGDDGYLDVLEGALREVRRFKPRWLVLSLGLDIMKGDPTGNFAVTPSGMRRVGRAIAAMNLPTLVVQEGGYTLKNLGAGCRAFFTGAIEHVVA